MLRLLLFGLLCLFSWPLALLLLLLYPLLWLLMLPFRVVGVAVDGVLALIRAIFYAPLRLLQAL